MQSVSISIHKILSKNFDPYIGLLLLVFFLGILIPTPDELRTVIKISSNIAVIALFFLYGIRLSSAEVKDGIKNFRLQSLVFLSTFVIFPLLGLVVTLTASPLLGIFTLGTLYLTLLPSTVQSSVSFTSMAGGNIAGAITAATISNLLGMIITPLLVTIFLNLNGTIGLDKFGEVLLKLMLPFFLGQLLGKIVPRLKPQRNNPYIKFADRATILLVVASATSTATALKIWTQVSSGMIFGLLFINASILTIMLLTTWNLGIIARMNREDRIALLMCGSKKSLATGLPMALIIFDSQQAVSAIVPVIIFHQLQLLVASFISLRLAKQQGLSE